MGGGVGGVVGVREVFFSVSADEWKEWMNAYDTYGGIVSKYTYINKL